MSDDEKLLRRLLWMRHGCDSSCLYGDDGELQCSNRAHWFMGIDFLRDSAKMIEWKLGSDLYKELNRMPDE